MRLQDELVMQVPSGALKQIVKNEGLESEVKLSSNEEMAEIIASKIPEVGRRLASEFKFAGATAVNVHMMINGISADWHNKEYFKDHLVKKYTGAIFAGGLRPELTHEPKLIRAHELADRMVLAFSYLGTPRRYLENYEIVFRSPQVLDYVVIHFSPFALEVRANQSQNDLFKTAVLEIMDIKEEVVWDKLTKLNDEQARQLALALGARLRAAKHKMTEGVYATKEVTANTQVEDLESQEQYQLEFSNQPMKKKTFVFKFPYSFGYEEESISYVITGEGLWFRSNVGEEAIRHVFEHILQIKFPKDESEEDQEFVEGA
ncbi:hypothetical protein P9314_08250 [Paenibacillus validus]|uniref:hypothetical protein n=1 Tax=Paenibacillus TaxID=44249 RepID=UPI000FDB1A11|nr:MULTISPECIES: hypothetical protein [Paenibacillus]MED4600693.1 hypothetical protein [Paenibacillus validus]MED4605332.1 hypothetical protein [Paenibacillus validus]